MNFVVSEKIHENIISFDISYLYEQDPDAEDNIATNFVAFHKLYRKKHQQFPLSRFSVGEVLVRTRSHIVVIQCCKQENLQELFQFPGNRFDEETLPDVLIWIGKGLHSVFHILLAMMIKKKKFIIIKNHCDRYFNNNYEEDINENIKNFANVFCSFLWKNNDEDNKNKSNNMKDKMNQENDEKEIQYQKKTLEIKNHVKQLFYNQETKQKKLLYHMEWI